jgi:hypothetical protein
MTAGFPLSSQPEEQPRDELAPNNLLPLIPIRRLATDSDCERTLTSQDFGSKGAVQQSLIDIIADMLRTALEWEANTGDNVEGADNG